MLQLGQEVTFSVFPTIDTFDVRFVWEFWDGEVRVTKTPHAVKIVDRSGTLVLTVSAVDPDGNSVSSSMSVPVNSPPVITSLTISANDLPVSYAVTATVVSPTAASYSWTLNGVTVGSTSTAIFNVTDAGENVLQLILADGSGGITTYSTILYGRANNPPEVTSIYQTPDNPVKGVGRQVKFMVIANDPEGNSAGLTFLWSSPSGPSPLTFSQVETEQGSARQSVATVNIPLQPTPPLAGTYWVQCTVRDTNLASYTVSKQFTLADDAYPVALSAFAIPNPTCAVKPNGSGIIQYGVAVADADIRDDLTFYWTITAPVQGVIHSSLQFPRFEALEGELGLVTASLTITDSAGATVVLNSASTPALPNVTLTAV